MKMKRIMKKMNTMNTMKTLNKKIKKTDIRGEMKKRKKKEAMIICFNLKKRKKWLEIKQ